MNYCLRKFLTRHSHFLFICLNYTAIAPLHYNKTFKTKLENLFVMHINAGSDRGCRPRDFLCLGTKVLFQHGTSQKLEFQMLVQKQSVYFLFFENLLKLKFASFSYIIRRTTMADLIYPTERAEKSWTQQSAVIYREKVL